MRISTKAEYACLALIDLAQSTADGLPKRVRDIAGAQGIPAPYLIQILLRLKAAGLVQSARGSDGGYQLARHASEITVGEIIAAIDGWTAPPRKGESIAARNLCDLMLRVHAAEQQILDATSIAELAVQHVPENAPP